MIICIIDGPTGEDQFVAYDDLHLVLPHEVIREIREKVDRSHIYWSHRRNCYVEYRITDVFYYWKDKNCSLHLEEI